MAKQSLIDSIWDECYTNYTPQASRLQQKEKEYKGFLEEVKKLRKGICIEIGRYQGASTLALSRYFSHVISIDILALPSDFPKLDNVDIIVGDTKNVNTYNLVQSILAAHNDLAVTCLFIDGDHSFQGCKSDFDTYNSLVSKGGKIVFHDILDTVFHRSQNCHVAGVWDAISGFSAKKEIIDESDLGWGGIGILTV